MKPFVVSCLALALAGCFTGDTARHLSCRSNASCGPGQTCVIPADEEWGHCDGPPPSPDTDTDTETGTGTGTDAGTGTGTETGLEPTSATTDGTTTDGTTTDGTTTDGTTTDGTTTDGTTTR